MFMYVVVLFRVAPVNSIINYSTPVLFDRIATCIDTNEPRHEKTGYAKTKTQISFAVTTKLINAFVFATYEGCPRKS